jgi:mersacidin/lichenicidin family type 2 lantibiotic
MAGIKINNLDIDIIRAWKDEDYRNSLSEEQRSQLPENPAGMIELSDEDMRSVVGGDPVAAGGSEMCCNCNQCSNSIIESFEFDTSLGILEPGPDFLP